MITKALTLTDFDFENTVFKLPVTDQAEQYSQILITGFNQFVPKNKFI